MAKILKCIKCGEYSLKKSCPRCGAETSNPVPLKFKFEDKYAEHRRKYKKIMGEGL